MAWREAARLVVIDLARFAIGFASDLSRLGDNHRSTCKGKTDFLEQELGQCRSHVTNHATCAAELAWAQVVCRRGWIEISLFFLRGLFLGGILVGLLLWYLVIRASPAPTRGQPVELLVSKSRKNQREVAPVASDGSLSERVVAARQRARAIQ